MAGRIVEEDIEALKRRADIVDIVSDHTQLKRSGSRWKGLCPFHDEKTPSFHVDPANNVFHCFGCNAGGDIYTFLEDIEGLSFVEAVEHLARRTGYQLRYEELTPGQKRALGERSRLVAANQAACEYFHEQLMGPDGEPARTYLKERGFGRDEAERFQLGFAPNDWDPLSRHLAQERFTEDEIIKAGLAKRGRRGSLRDTFRGRLVFPILDLSGDPIGFGGRVLPGLDYGDYEPPKYLNSPETPIFKKSRVLYGMSWARPQIVRDGQALVCEGYTDVMALHQAGLENAVATCGTAMGAEHIGLLQRYADTVVLAFDSDEAGAKAAERAWELSRGRDLQVRVLVMPPGEDPADVVADGGPEAMQGLLGEAEPVIRFMLRRAASGHDDSPEGRSDAVDAVAPLLAGIPEPVLRDQYTRWVADDLLGIGLGVVAQAVERSGGDVATVEHRPSDPGPADRSELSARAKLERETLGTVLQHPHLLPDRWQEVTEDDLVHPRALGVFQAIQAAGGPGAELSAILDQAEDDDERALVRAMALEELTVEPDEPHVTMLVNRLLLRRCEQDIAERKAELERMNPTTDPDAYRERFEELIALEARRRDLNKDVEP